MNKRILLVSLVGFLPPLILTITVFCLLKEQFIEINGMDGLHLSGYDLAALEPSFRFYSPFPLIGLISLICLLVAIVAYYVLYLLRVKRINFVLAGLFSIIAILLIVSFTLTGKTNVENGIRIIGHNVIYSEFPVKTVVIILASFAAFWMAISAVGIHFISKIPLKQKPIIETNVKVGKDTISINDVTYNIRGSYLTDDEGKVFYQIRKQYIVDSKGNKIAKIF